MKSTIEKATRVRGAVSRWLVTYSLVLGVAGQATCGGPRGGGPSCLSCRGTCVDAQTDPNNCGACGNVCSPGLVCWRGICAATCPTGLANCSGSCVDTQSDDRHCGSCSNSCSAVETCASGACVCSASPCGGQCVDVQTDPLNCGACGSQCPPRQKCTKGVCATCTRGLTATIDGTPIDFCSGATANAIFTGSWSTNVSGVSGAGDFLRLSISRITTGTFDCNMGDAFFDYSPAGSTTLDVALSCTIVVTSYGAVGERIVGSFSGTLESSRSVTGGSFDLVRGPDR